MPFTEEAPRVLSAHTIQRASSLVLQWHAEAPTLEFAAVQAWMLTTLRSVLRFDGAIWALLADSGDNSPTPQINGACVLRLDDAVMDDFERLQAPALLHSAASGAAVNVSHADAAGRTASCHDQKDHALRFGLANSISVRFSMPGAPVEQFILLTRSAVSDRFSSEDTFAFELMAQHMMVAYTNRRTLFVDSANGVSQQPSFAVAVVDRAGILHDQDARFLAMLQREWSDWPGKRLPEVLLDLAARRTRTRWRFLGEQVTAEFVPVDDLYLVTARARRAADLLTPREADIAQRYSQGGGFRDIAQSVQLSPATVRSHLRNIYSKLQIRNKSQLTVLLK